MAYNPLIFQPYHYCSRADRKHLKGRCWSNCDATITLEPSNTCRQYNRFDDY